MTIMPKGNTTRKKSCYNRNCRCKYTGLFF